MEFKGFTLDDFQEEAVRKIEKNNSVIVSAPTGSGKTLIADYIIDMELKGDNRVIYTAPIKALSNQKFKDFCEDYGEENIGLVTGDVVINPQAQVLIMTTEIYRNMAIMNDPVLNDVSYCIMDEIHYIGDVERGYVWEESIIFSGKHIRFLFLSATVPNAGEFASWVQTVKDHKVDVIEYHVRPVPLEIKFFDTELGITDLASVRKKKELDDFPDYHQSYHRKRFKKKMPRLAPPDYRELIKELAEAEKLPCIYFVFSRAKTQEYALKLSKKNDYLTSDEKRKVSRIVSDIFRRMSPEVLSLKSAINLRQCIGKGIAFHHAGLVPDMKHIVEKLFSAGLVKVLFATETFAVGINMPAKTVCFDALRKYTGEGFRYLNSKEFFQISGRAGRRGIDKKGLSVSLIHRRADDMGKIASFTDADRMPIQSQFRLSYNTILNMVNQHTPEEIEQILKMNFFTYQELKGKVDDPEMLRSIRARYDKAYRLLEKMGYIQDHELTELGLFTTKIYSNELEISQIFSKGIGIELDEYATLMILAALIYEDKRMIKFYKKYPTKQLFRIRDALQRDPFISRDRWFRFLLPMTALIQPAIDGKKFTDIMKNTNLLEGDIIRIFMQILDKLEQIDKATYGDHEMQARIRNCKQIIRNSLEGINIF